MYSHANTTPMIERGSLIRDVLPRELRGLAGTLAPAANLPPSDFFVEGRDGTGQKSQIPWVRIGSKRLSPRATVGWYVVFLFARDGSAVYLALAHGSTEFRNRSFAARSDIELKNLMRWSRSLLDEFLSSTSRLTFEVDLRSSATLASAYSKSCVASYKYSVDAIPTDNALQDDLVQLLSMLSALHEADRVGLNPLVVSDIRDVEDFVEAIAKPRNATGQGLSLSSEERCAIEAAAMRAATTYLSSLGYEVTDRSRTESYDLLAMRDGTSLHVEVKGTTGLPVAVLLTSNEVDLHRRHYPNNALIVVHSITLKSSADYVNALGGTVQAWIPWEIDPKMLKPITYRYLLPRE
jgi:hypothetical protein